ncbi:MAG TPA: LLM class flavin-dependent oxidoreductase [Candidatus Limnocylindrales bacterium]|nr:LLM class flavin-dependent oxidoreductase [Candidatus Limnocylindrales bacterium]
MRFALMLEPQQGLTYADQLAIARLAERLGFEALFRSDHYATFPGDADGPTTDAWTVLAGLARETSTIRLGSLVSPVTFRHPGAFVKIVTTVDEMSDARVEVGVGAGWNEADHGPLGLPFPPIEDRADLLEDELAMLHGLWTEDDGWTYAGKQVTVTGARLRARPVDAAGRIREHGRPRPRILTGGDGSPRGLRIAARWADEFNISSSSPERTAERMAMLDDACRAIGRDPASLARSAMVGVLVAADEADLRRRRDAMLRTFAISQADAESWLEGRRKRWIVGTPEEARSMVRRFADAGIERIMLQDFLPWDHAMIELLATELIGKV